MNISDIVKTVDHTLLDPRARESEIKTLCDEAVKYGAASVCVPPCHVAFAAKYLGGKVAVCTVIGFPNGYSSCEVKCFEAKTAIADGADEIDMVINLCRVADGRFDAVESEIRAVKKVCGGHILKVIIETCLLSEDEKLRLCAAVSAAGADYIKTSTGFAGGGATKEDVALLCRECPPSVKVKASGGIKSLEDAEAFLALGAKRLGTSRVIKSLITGGRDLNTQK